MKTYNKLILGVISISSVAMIGCKDKMVELNTNPDVMMNADVAQQFVGATEKFGYKARHVLNGKYDGVMALMQYITRYTGDGSQQPYVNVNRPEEKAPGSWGSQYEQFFAKFDGQRLYNLKKYISQQVDNGRYDDVKAICDVLSVYQQWNILANYGALTYDEAFKGISEGITQPKYQTIQAVWQDLDTRLKAAIDILKTAPRADVYKLGKSDFFYGWTNIPTQGGGSTAAEVTEYTLQRQGWLKFANIFRFEMAWMLAKVQPAHFETVKSEVLAIPNGLMTKIADGAYYNYAYDYDTNTDDVLDISKHFGVGESFINAMKRLDDPRLPYLARPNGLASELSPNFLAMKTYFPDSLAKYGDLMTGKNIYVGANTSPQYFGTVIWNGSNFPTAITKSFNNLKNPNYPAALTVKFGGEDIEICPKDQATFNISLQVVSSSQGRYYVKCGGKGDNNGPTDITEDVNMYRFDGDGNEVENMKWLLRRSVYTYAQQCFLFAISGTNAGGKSPAQWYADGVEAAMAELSDDAQRYGIQVAVNSKYPAIPNTRLATIPYTYDPTAEAAAMVAKAPYSLENTMAQAWIYFYNQPEVAYMWWLRTGLIPVKAHADVQSAANDPVAYLEKPSKKDTNLEFPRRGCLPARNTVNANFDVIKAELIAQPGFGEWMNTTGRIWWDTK